MDWRKLFPVGDILPTGERQELEKLDQGVQQLRSWAQKIEAEWPKDSRDRDSRLSDMAARFANTPSAELYEKMTILAAFPSNLPTSWQARESVLGIIHGQVERLMEPERPIVRRVLSRALDAAERELAKQEKKEKDAAAAEGFPYSPSGRVLTLQQRVLNLRNEVAKKYPGDEGATQHPGNWRQRLEEFL